jgi:hypothetical protein
MAAVESSAATSGVVLVIAGAGAGPLEPGLRAVTIAYPDLDARTLGTLLPELVIMPLFGNGFDAMEGLQRLERLGYLGTVIVRGPRLPNRAIVERELSAIVPVLTVRLTGPIN